MYKYVILAVGRMKNKSLANLVGEYHMRLQRQGSCELVELKDGPTAVAGQRILDALDKRREATVYALAEEGTPRNSVAFANELESLQGQPAVFILGGAYGLSDAVKARADQLLSLSQLTFTHEIARLLLVEQLYRTVAIQRGTSYHHD